MQALKRAVRNSRSEASLGGLTETAIDTVRGRLAGDDDHLGRAFNGWVARAYAYLSAAHRLADYFERGCSAKGIPTCVLVSYAAVAKAYLEAPHGPKGLRVQGERLERVRAEITARLGGRRTCPGYSSRPSSGGGSSNRTMPCGVDCQVSTNLRST